jgi:hypothetical protein
MVLDEFLAGVAKKVKDCVKSSGGVPTFCVGALPDGIWWVSPFRFESRDPAWTERLATRYAHELQYRGCVAYAVVSETLSPACPESDGESGGDMITVLVADRTRAVSRSWWKSGRKLRHYFTGSGGGPFCDLLNRDTSGVRRTGGAAAA